MKFVVLFVVFWVWWWLFMTYETKQLKQLIDCHGQCVHDPDCQDRCKDYCPNHR